MTTQNASKPSEFEGILPGTPAPYFLERGEGEKSVVFDTLFTIMLSGDETDGQYGVFTTEGPAGEMIPPHLHPHTHEIFFIIEGAVRLWLDDRAGFSAQKLLTNGGFCFIPAGTVHAFRIESDARVLGVSTGGFERFFHGIGKPTDKPGIPAAADFYVPSGQQFGEAGETYGTVFLPDFTFKA